MLQSILHLHNSGVDICLGGIAGSRCKTATASLITLTGGRELMSESLYSDHVEDRLLSLLQLPLRAVAVSANEGHCVTPNTSAGQHIR